MKPFFSIVFSLLLSTLFLSAQTPSHTPIVTLFQKIKDFEKQEWQKDSIVQHPLRSQTEDRFEREYKFYGQLNGELMAINKASLTVKEQVNYELLRHDILDNLASYRYKSYLNPIISYQGFHTSLASQGNRNLGSKKDADQYIVLLKDIPRYIEENLQLMRTGLKLGISRR